MSSRHELGENSFVANHVNARRNRICRLLILELRRFSSPNVAFLFASVSFSNLLVNSISFSNCFFCFSRSDLLCPNAKTELRISKKESMLCLVSHIFIRNIEREAQGSFLLYFRPLQINGNILFSLSTKTHRGWENHVF